MKWSKHKLDSERGPLSVYYTRDNAEIVPICAATIPEPTFVYELIVAGRHVCFSKTLAAAKAAADGRKA